MEFPLLHVRSACNVRPVPATTPLPVRDQHHIRSAEGWLELGDWRSANEELDNITPQLRAHPVVLQLRFCVYSAAENWELALAVAEAFVKMLPDKLDGWIHRSFALHELK